MTVILDGTKECLGIVYGQTLEKCLAEAVKKAGGAAIKASGELSKWHCGHNGEAAKAGLLRRAANPPRKRQTMQRH